MSFVVLNKNYINNMRNKIILIILGIFLISNVSAISLIAGTSYTWNFSKDFSNIRTLTYKITNNLSNLNGLNISIEGDKAILTTKPNYKPDNFTLIFIINENKEVEEGGGGCLTKWDCSKWSSCRNGLENRTCKKEINYCETYKNKPNQNQNCFHTINTTINKTNNKTIPYKKPLNKLPTKNKYETIIAILLMILLLFYYYKNRKKFCLK